MFTSRVEARRRTQRVLITPIFLAIWLGCSTVSGATNFFPLGDLPGGGFQSQALGVSADGSTVVGWSHSSANFEPFRWTRNEGMIGLGHCGICISHETKSFAAGVSGDGSTIVGWSAREIGNSAFRWTAEDGMGFVGDPFTGDVFASKAMAITPDGGAVVGQALVLPDSYLPFRWTETEGIVSLGDVSNGVGLAEARAVTPDGNTVVGTTRTPLAIFRSFRWTPSTGLVTIDTNVPPGQGYSTEANAVSANGQVIVGEISSAFQEGRQAYRWTPSTGIVGLGDLPGGIVNSVAYGVSADGSTIVGQGTSNLGNEAFIWTTTYGMMSLRNFLITHNYVQPSELFGWILREARAITPDGLTIVGTGRNPSGEFEAWMVRIPEPSTLVLLAIGGMLLSARRRRTV